MYIRSDLFGNKGIVQNLNRIEYTPVDEDKQLQVKVGYMYKHLICL